MNAQGIIAGSTDISRSVLVGQVTGLAFNTSGLIAYYWRQGAAPVAITLVALSAINDAFLSSGFIEVDSVHLIGHYRLDIPNAALVAGAEWVVICVTYVDAGGFATVWSETLNLTTIFPSAGLPSVADYSQARAARLDNLDAAITTRLASAGYTAPDNAGIATLLTRVSAARALLLDNLALLDAAISTRLADADYVEPDNSSIASIKARTDNLPSDPADQSLIVAATNSLANLIGAPVGASLSADIAAVPTAAEIDAQLSGAHGNGDWDGGSSGSDPLENEVPGTYEQGTAGFALGRIGVAEIAVASPVTLTGDVYVIRGDSYLAADGRAIEFLDSEGAWPDLTGAAAKFFGQSLEVTAAIINPAGPGRKIRVEFTSANTTDLESRKTAYAVRVTDADEHLITLVQGRMIVKEAYSA